MSLEIGTRYSGGFIKGEPNGFGVQTNPEGVVYTGLWENGIKSGTGSLDFGDGTSFVGEFQNGLASEGIYDWGDGRKTDSYQNEEGEWLDR